MKRFPLFLFLVCAISSAQAAPPNLTIYNGGFAVIRESVALDLKEGENDVRFARVTSGLDPGTIILRDIKGKTELNIVQQKFRNAPLSLTDMLQRFEGQTLDFIVTQNGKTETVKGKIIRGEYPSPAGEKEKTVPPLIEIDGLFQLGLPGTPKFPTIPAGLTPKPEIAWTIKSPKPAKLDAELAYLTEGLRWEADYDAVVGDNGNISELLGWITIRNDTGVRFENATVSAVAGDVGRIQSSSTTAERVIVTGSNVPMARAAGPQPNRFDEYQEYKLPRPLSLANGEVTQVELVRATNVVASRSYVYDGATNYYDSRNYAELSPQVGADSSSKVAIVVEFKNSTASHLGMPLPQGRLHFYRLDDAKRLQFTGDSQISNTPPDETVRTDVGNAFDLIGERKQLDFRVNDEKRIADESFEIKLRNHKSEPVEIRVFEHPFRWRQWEIKDNSEPFKKLDGVTIEFRVQVKPNEEKAVKYSVRYSQFPPPRS